MQLSTKTHLCSLLALAVNAITSLSSRHSVDAAPITSASTSEPTTTTTTTAAADRDLPSELAQLLEQSGETFDSDPNARLPPAPVAYFTTDQSDKNTYKTDVYYGPVRTKSRLLVSYDVARAKCEHVFDDTGVDTWSVHLGYQSTTGQVFPKYRTMGYIDRDNQTVRNLAVIPPMEQPGKAYFWFYCTNGAGQVEFDSNFGANWEVEVTPSMRM
ncbi:hypothetical protein HK102_011447 [Quaeritorhiza haematococci]|nr:hypothetical protein HK102_011447 [Quaeritorhiza haematococci]